MITDKIRPASRTVGMTHSPSPKPSSTTATRNSSPPAPTGDQKLQIDPVPAMTLIQSSPYPLSQPTPSIITTVLPRVMNQYQKIFSHDALRPAHHNPMKGNKTIEMTFMPIETLINRTASSPWPRHTA